MSTLGVTVNTYLKENAEWPTLNNHLTSTTPSVTDVCYTWMMSKQSKAMLFGHGFVKLLTWIYQSLLIFPPDLLIARGLSSPRSPHGLAWLPLLIANSRHTPPVSTYDYNISPPAIFIVWRSPPTTTTTTTIFLHLQYLLCVDIYLWLQHLLQYL